jgi:hypothetical protein
VLSQLSPSSCVGTPCRCAVSHVIRRVLVWVSRWSYLALWWPVTDAETVSDTVLYAVTHLSTHSRLRYPWWQATVMETQSNKSFHWIGIISKLIQIHSRTSCQLLLRYIKILTKATHFMCTTYFFYQDFAVTRFNLCTWNLRPCYAAVFSTFIHTEIYRNSKLILHFTIILSIHKYKLRNALFCSYNITITVE